MREEADLLDDVADAAPELDDVLLAALAPLGTLVGQFLRRRSAQIALQENVDYVGAVLGKVADGVITTDEGGVIESFNYAVERLFGYEAAELQGAEVKTLLAEPYRAELVRFLGITLRPENPPAAGADVREMWGRRKDGSTFPIDFRASRVLLGGRARLVGIVRDLSQQKTERETLQFMALHDPLTGLPNRTLFQDRLRQAILGGRRGRRALALMILDLDRFKEVNDTLGHEAGDHLLRQVALGLGQVLRQSDTVARLGGDEFAVLLAGETKPQGAAETARKILETLGRPQEFRGRRIETAASVGIAMFPEHGEDAETLLRHADAAMYVAKRRRSGFAVYSPRQQEGRVARLELLDELGQAIVRDELVLHYQPRVDLKSGRTLGAEALVRWQHPRLGLIPPDQFLAAAEETEVIRPLTRWVLNQALRQFRVWADTGLVVDINVNVSARNLFDRDFSDMTLDLLGTWNVEPVRLELDVNESALTASSASGSIERLGALGVGLSIDDFGPGRASLAHLKGLPIRTIKIDKSLVSDSLNDGARVSALRPLIEMAHTMNLSIVAEGVESQETWDRLAAIGCDSAQGYYVCPPIFAADLTEWLREPPRAWTHAARPG